MASEPPLERPPSQSNQAQTSTLTIAPTTAQLIQHWSTTWNHIKTFLRQNKLVDADEACAYLLRDEKLGTIWKGCCHLVLATVIVMTRSRFRSLNAVALSHAEASRNEFQLLVLGENDFFGTDRLVSEALLQLAKDAVAALQNAANDRAGRRALIEPLSQIREKLLAIDHGLLVIY